MTLPADVARCPGYQADGEWREGCEDCMRRTSPPPDHHPWIPNMAPPRTSGDRRTGANRDGRMTATDKRLSTIQASAALRGIEVNPDGSGGYVVRMQGHPWERAAADMDALVALLGRMGVVA